jgi:surfactin synthase thioesterase subunit
MGAAHVYYPLRAVLQECAEVVSLELPGHGERLAEPLCASVQEMAKDAFERVRAELERPYYLFGYSMGALVCYELGLLVEDAGLPLPERLFLYASAAPDTMRTQRGYDRMGRKEIIAELERMGGTEDEALASEELMDFVVPLARADLHAVECYAPTRRGLSCAAHVVWSPSDEMVAPGANGVGGAEGWGAFFDGVVSCGEMEGGHFSFFANEEVGARCHAELGELIRRDALGR